MGSESSAVKEAGDSTEATSQRNKGTGAYYLLLSSGILVANALKHEADESKAYQLGYAAALAISRSSELLDSPTTDSASDKG
jgi:hypothetical protein